MTRKHSAEAERRIREAALDWTLSATFPASDALSSLPNPDDDSVEDVSTISSADSMNDQSHHTVKLPL